MSFQDHANECDQCCNTERGGCEEGRRLWMDEEAGDLHAEQAADASQDVERIEEVGLRRTKMVGLKEPRWIDVPCVYLETRDSQSGPMTRGNCNQLLGAIE